MLPGDSAGEITSTCASVGMDGGDAHHLSAGPFNQSSRGRHLSARFDPFVDQQDACSHQCEIRSHFEPLVGAGVVHEPLPKTWHRELPGFANQDQSTANVLGQGSTEHEAQRVHGGDRLILERVTPLGERIDERAKRWTVGKQWAHIVAWPWCVAIDPIEKCKGFAASIAISAHARWHQLSRATPRTCAPPGCDLDPIECGIEPLSNFEDVAARVSRTSHPDHPVFRGLTFFDLA